MQQSLRNREDTRSHSMNDIVVYEGYNRPSLLKPMFVIFNVVAYTAYGLAVMSFSFQAESLRS